MAEQEKHYSRMHIMISNFSANFSNLIIFFVIIYFLFAVGRSVIASYQDRQNIENKKLEISKLQLELITLENQNLYFQTQSFKEKEARKKLGMIKPGENVVALDRMEGSNQIQKAILSEQKIKIPNYIKWWKYFSQS